MGKQWRSRANYKIEGGTHSVTINPKPVTITGTKQYDGDTVVHSNSTEAQINLGVVGESLLGLEMEFQHLQM